MKRLLLSFLILTIGFVSYSSGEPLIVSKAIKGDLPLDPMDSIWDTAKAAVIPLAPQNLATPGITKPTIQSVKVWSLHNNKDIAFRIEWYDPTRDDTVNMSDKFSDACALQLPLNTDEEPSIMMGQKGIPVHIIQWRASWEKDMAMGYQDVEHAYPNYNIDGYPMMMGRPKAVYPISDFPKEARVFMPGLSVGNSLSNPNITLSVEELNAEGFGTLTVQEKQNSKGKGVWDYAYWKVVILKPLNSGDIADTVITPGKTVPLAIAVWDGGKNNVGGRKNFSEGGWIGLKIE